MMITNEALTLSDIPSTAASWPDIARFALTFNGYEVWEFEVCAEIANARRHNSLTDLRTCLFFEQRRWRHFGEDPEGEDMAYIREVVEKIRGRVAVRDLA